MGRQVTGRLIVIAHVTTTSNRANYTDTGEMRTTLHLSFEGSRLISQVAWNSEYKSSINFEIVVRLSSL